MKAILRRFSPGGQGAITRLVVFLGNPGAKYDKTRHNAGFLAADALEKTLNIKINRFRFKALTAAAELGGERVLLMKPQTFMNLSGEAASQALRFYKIPTERLIVVSDDTALPAGKLRIRRDGSAGGHNGLKDIIAKCGGEGFPRVKIGVGAPPNPEYEMIDWVLGKFSDAETKLLDGAVTRAAAAIPVIIAEGVDKAMNKYNG
jgi:PTH1 family peptidyl-tRNA hydrolase